MECLIKPVLHALQDAGLAAVEAMPCSPMPRLKGAACAVRLLSAEGGAYQYLGIVQTPDQGAQALYGRQLHARIQIRIFSPTDTGGAGCSAAAERICCLLTGGIAGLSVTGFTVDACAYDAKSDCFACPVTADVSAYVYAAPSADGTGFTDFTLKGTIV